MQPLPSSRISDERMAKPVDISGVERQHESNISKNCKSIEATGIKEVPSDEHSLTHIF
jgi:hypothetical protein